MGIFSRKTVSKTYRVHGKSLMCSVCEHEKFSHRPSQLNTAGMSMLGLDWANKTAHCCVCERCSHIEWFLNEL